MKDCSRFRKKLVYFSVRFTTFKIAFTTEMAFDFEMKQSNIVENELINHFCITISNRMSILYFR